MFARRALGGSSADRVLPESTTLLTTLAISERMNILDAVGRTPMVRLKEAPDSAAVYVKLEYFNAGGSIKSRVALAMVESAEANGRLAPGDTLLEPTGGNTGVGLALAAITRGYRFIAVVPDNYSVRRIKLLRDYGAIVELSDSRAGNDSHITLAREILANNPTFKHLDQFNNPACVDAHYHGTGEEIISACTPDAFVCSVGSGATFSGIGSRLRHQNARVHLQIVQPLGCDIMNGTAVRHSIQGTALGIKPPLLQYALVDSTSEVSLEDVQTELRRLMRSEGLYLGASSGANILAARRLACRLEPTMKVCTVAPDGGDYYPDVYDV